MSEHWYDNPDLQPEHKCSDDCEESCESCFQIICKEAEGSHTLKGLWFCEECFEDLSDDEEESDG